MAKPDNDATMRLNRYLARAGHGSRRAAEDLIRQGKVKIAGEVVRDLGRQVNLEKDQVEVDDKPVRLPEDFRVYAFHKPLDVVSTLRAQGGQPSLVPYRIQADIPERFVPVGRLDSMSTGLLLWTDDGALNQVLCRPGSGVWKRYEVELNGPLPATKLPLLTKGGIRLDGRPCLPCRLEMDMDKTTRHWIMELHEGRKRQIRRMFSEIDLKVLRLHRTDVGPINLGKLRPGDFRRLTRDEVLSLRREATGNRERDR